MSDFNGKLTIVCASAGTIASVISKAFGGWDNGITTLVIFMALDYIMGLIVAGVFQNSEKSESGGLSSKACWMGLLRKIVTLVFVMVAHRLDLLIGTNYIKTGVIIAFCTSELISICENAGLMEIPLPRIITKAIDILKNKSENSEEDDTHDDN